MWPATSAGDRVRSFALSNEAYTEPEIATTLEDAGFTAVRSYPSLSGGTVCAEHDLPVIVAER